MKKYDEKSTSAKATGSFHKILPWNETDNNNLQGRFIYDQSKFEGVQNDEFK
jgi:hypothetical protein